ncbi:MAG: hypothetical protein HY680_05720 [Chloroflexi bacterium]|nr:hypothetical protein [Chloroflexota bacterium]
MQEQETPVGPAMSLPGQPTSFVIRLWLEHSPQGAEWRGHVTHVQDQAEAYFRDFSVLLDFLGRHSGARVPLQPGGARADLASQTG